MKDMRVLEDLKETVLRDLKPVADKNSLTPTEVSVAKDAVCLLKEINKVLGGGMNPMMTSEGPHHMRSMGGHSYGYYDPHMYESYSYGHHDWMDPYDSSMMRGRDGRTGRVVTEWTHLVDVIHSVMTVMGIPDVIATAETTREIEIWAEAVTASMIE